MPRQYDYIIFDADETLFHFDAQAGLRDLFEKYDIEFTKKDFEEYQQVNKPLWVQYQDGDIDAKTLQITRFDSWATKLGVSPESLNDGFLESMADICKPLHGAQDLVKSLIERGIKLAIITNGFTGLQQKRLQRTGFWPYFDHVVISEQYGIAKPHVSIFEHTLSLLDCDDKSKALMVGDTLGSDIKGGNNAGIDTCWVNHDQLSNATDIIPTKEVRNLIELRDWLSLSLH
ncbi:pyrimidine 5'-nucleotidase [Marinomonas mediterranea]|jgi:HAD superfamily (subfamily IA) hydrolase, TIGR02254|uniref:HAD superfamily (Subfamily IA) hydrolase, TIGR02254 n=1 Tax=Marinomonas mediterranea (strain ATCC 700492 / JCM 21426 / NBRC 103028 / MMB-1) TaxID=717774 RepID=F2JTG4_MARM1|nr:pyrimidine 5'-nucleotidase [Marinomonas mediterranea]ADZ91478.1 HAD superfamily (subfamily IA) hydrolase, TIGR02254 [Marinomonas mediterranea MMB-1]WCN09445.1 pyrimidine 5'-nucleotidase [Marinomonas mediterranea]WCN17587.1 pyrimidine 5'-nucleotidase [Marinomonas mediterranea MMB-1]